MTLASAVRQKVAQKSLRKKGESLYNLTMRPTKNYYYYFYFCLGAGVGVYVLFDIVGNIILWGYFHCLGKLFILILMHLCCL